MLGRPTDFSPELADSICERIASGESLRAICEEEAFPNKATVFRWLAAQKDFSDQYARAREVQAEFYAEEIVSIADTPQIGVKTKENEDGIETTTGDMIEHRRLQVEARKWVVSKLLPKKYGDKLDMNLAGKDGGPIQAAIAVTFVRTNGSDQS